MSYSEKLRRLRSVPTDGGDAPNVGPPVAPITRVAVDYVIDDVWGKAEIVYCYELGTRVIMADGSVLPVEWLEPGMRFRLEDGGVATVTKVDEPSVYEPPSQKKDKNGNSLRRIIGRVKYTGYFPRFDLGILGETLKTTPGHLFFSVTRNSWQPAESFQRGELLRNFQGLTVPVEWISQVRIEFCELYNFEVEEFHTFFCRRWSARRNLDA